MLLANTSSRVPETIVLGFSKGRTVVNQLITEFAHSKPTKELSDGLQQHLFPSSKDYLLCSISRFHFIDVSLNCGGAYLTDTDIIKQVGVGERAKVLNGTATYVLHGMPRQWSDKYRPWINWEKDLLLQLLKDEAKSFGGNLQVDDRFNFADMRPNMQMHFEVIDFLDPS